MKRRVLASLGLGAVIGGSTIAAACSDETTLGGNGTPPPGSDGSADVVTTTDGGNDVTTPSDGGADADAAPPPTPAEQGLAISPVPIPSGLSADQKAQVGLGSYLVNAVAGCPDCHNTPGPPPLKYLAGGTPFPIDGNNIVYARNLTADPSNTGFSLTEQAFIDSMRTGKDAREIGSILIVMPWQHFRWMSTDDLKAIYAYLKIIPIVANPTPADVKTNSILNGAPGAAPTQYDEGDVARPLPAEGTADPGNTARGLAIRPLDAPANLGTLTAAQQAAIGRGSYLANAAACSDCHTNPERLEMRPGKPNYLKMNTAIYLTGGRTFPVPDALQPVLKQVRSMSADLTGTTTGYFNESDDSLEKFVSIITTGTHADEAVDGGTARALGWPMPWQAFKNMVPSDLEAVYRYVKTIPGRTDKQTQDYARYCTGNTDCDTAAGETCSTATKECVGETCTAATEKETCNACQTCTGAGQTKCVAPTNGSTCVAQGI